MSLDHHHDVVVILDAFSTVVDGGNVVLMYVVLEVDVGVEVVLEANVHDGHSKDIVMDRKVNCGVRAIIT